MKSINVSDLVKKQKQQYTPATPPKTDLSSCAVYAQFVQYASTDVGLLSTYLQDTAVETSEMSEDTASSSLSRVTTERPINSGGGARCLSLNRHARGSHVRYFIVPDMLR